jgi:signal transduction histidine kinase
VGQLNTIFERFHRIDQSRVTTDGSGSGLGLTIARAIVTDHGGTLIAYSDGVGSGSRFTMSLPALDEAGSGRRHDRAATSRESR